jgi:Cu2+-exporting ATPase
MASRQTTAVLEVAGVQWASEKATVERVLGRRPGVVGVEANPVGQTATVTYDPARTSVADLAAWIRDCGYHCAGQSVPRHVCDPTAEPQADGPGGQTTVTDRQCPPGDCRTGTVTTGRDTVVTPG